MSDSNVNEHSLGIDVREKIEFFPKRRYQNPEPLRPVMTVTEVPSAVNHPQHYGGDTVYEAIKVIEAWGLGFHLGNTVKYISRAGKKDPAKEIEDLEKGLFYLQRRIRLLKERQNELAAAVGMGVPGGDSSVPGGEPALERPEDPELDPAIGDSDDSWPYCAPEAAV